MRCAPPPGPGVLPGDDPLGGQGEMVSAPHRLLWRQALGRDCRQGRNLPTRVRSSSTSASLNDRPRSTRTGSVMSPFRSTTFAGLMSLWVTPFSRHRSKTSASLRTQASAAFASAYPPCSTKAWRVPPGMYFVAKYIGVCPSSEVSPLSSMRRGRPSLWQRTRCLVHHK